MNNKKGIAEVGVVAVVILAVVLIAAGFYFLMQKNSTFSNQNTAAHQTKKSQESDESTSEVFNMGPVSDKTDTGTIQSELEETLLGDFEEDVVSIEKEASGL